MLDERNTAAFGNQRSVCRHEGAQALHRCRPDAANPAQVVDGSKGAVRLSVLDDCRRRLRANLRQRLQAVDTGLVDRRGPVRGAGVSGAPGTSTAPARRIPFSLLVKLNTPFPSFNMISLVSLRADSGSAVEKPV